MEYTLHQLRIFVKLVEHRSITKTAEAIFLTQPAVSVQLKKLQAQFKIPLTEVVGRQLYITEFGMEIAKSAQRILDEAELINNKTSAFQGKLTGKLKLSIVSTAKYVMPYFLSDFMQTHPNIDLVMDVTNRSRVIQSLEKNEVDFAMVSVMPDNLILNEVELMQNKLYLVGGTKNGKRKSSINKLIKETPLLFREKGSATRNAMEKFLKSKNISSTKKIELTSNEALKQAIIAGLGYSIMPLIGLSSALKNGDLEIIKFKGLPIATTWKLVWLKSKKLMPVAEAFLEQIQNNKEDIIANSFDWYEKYCLYFT